MRSVDKEETRTKKKGKANVKSSQEKQRKYYRGRKTRERKEQIKSFLGQKVLLYDARRKTQKGRAMDKESSGPHEITETVETSTSHNLEIILKLTYFLPCYPSKFESDPWQPKRSQTFIWYDSKVKDS